MLLKFAEEKEVDLRLLGFRYDIPEIIRCSDIGVLPSLREGLGLFGIQSLASGVPVVGSRVQGIRDYILEGKTGYLCEPTDAEAFGRAIQKLALLSDVQRERMKTECKKKAREFSSEVSIVGEMQNEKSIQYSGIYLFDVPWDIPDDICRLICRYLSLFFQIRG